MMQGGTFSKIEEELAELRQAYADGDLDGMSEELGDLLFSVVNLSRFLEVNPEESLNGATRKFIERFAFIEKATIMRGVDLKDMGLEELDKLWIEARKCK